jgi:tripartite-type tricarboxylate transporter receptor subunit TctC
MIALLACCAGAQAHAQTAYPDRPIRLVVPFPPGGGTDSNARAIAKEVEATLGQSIVVDNRGGANAILGSDIVAKATPNGYTLMHVSVAFAINPSTHKKLPFDAVRDFTPITNPLVGQGSCLVVHPAVAARSVKEFIALAKREKLRFSSPGVGNVLHLIAEAFNSRAGIQLLHVPYKGSAPSMVAVIGGEVQMAVIPPIIAMPHFEAKRLRALGYSGAKRIASLPDLPTISEAGLPGFQLDTGWHAWFAPANTPDPIVQKIYAAVAKAVQTPKVRDYLLSGGYEPTADPPAVFQKNLPRDIKRWAELVRIAKVQPI